MKLKQEDRQLLLKDLSARLPYHPMVHIKELGGIDYENYLYADYLDLMMSYSITLKPYLRPMSSMSKEEDKEWQYYKNAIAESCDESLEERISELHDWFNAHHLDYRGLIPMGLANEATEGMYNIFKL